MNECGDGTSKRVFSCCTNCRIAGIIYINISLTTFPASQPASRAEQVRLTGRARLLCELMNGFNFKSEVTSRTAVRRGMKRKRQAMAEEQEMLAVCNLF